ncbi:non-heme iron oxygenase ferredoxin subunit [Enemella evansiae]|uniref:2Fe-2S ferredoxin n=2 Tax=Enemella evansiae TaxID=2016499 RepID=A0A255FVZ9_9ACTN|nr:non-heme iron oxygenase ferredoxin subunit [Enemella evansiae]PFG66644.1 3-phenylpropionate/trans-cinnamate dioxygenase ferredoxin subunit [Propionibacteriaceae bacterium ES.041]OYN93470.1 2Fe-2S ferredoxin [Enemella evansiae]OYO05864.1 2Fe-2S ferredoxin [Enemella evansiae]OYO07880.1 2Fe-2S ferredoxin [Enemella evansiae]OYO14985.1 2Fe-2S ferredoxin [Enemella evansiae]
MSEAVRVADVNELEPGQAMKIDAEIAGTEDDVCLARTADGTFYAVDNTCSHQLAWLDEGWVEGDTIECPVHSSEFCLKTGVPLTLPATEPVATHRVEVRDEGVWLLPDEVTED